jgi:hypothetical protein
MCMQAIIVPVSKLQWFSYAHFVSAAGPNGKIITIHYWINI